MSAQHNRTITACLGQAIYKHFEVNSILAEQQKGCRKDAQGCAKQLLIDKVVTNQAYKRKRNSYLAYIDHQKVLDSVPHSWLLQILKIYKINPRISFLSSAMKLWRTVPKLQTENQNITTNPIRIKWDYLPGGLFKSTLVLSCSQSTIENVEQ